MVVIGLMRGMLERSKGNSRVNSLSLVRENLDNFPFLQREKLGSFPSFPQREKVENLREFPREGKCYIYKYIFRFTFPTVKGESSCALAEHNNNSFLFP